MPDALKAKDLQRDPRYALHCPTVDAPEPNQADWLGDAKIAGRAVEVDNEGSHKFRMDVTEVVLTKLTAAGDQLQIESWHPDRGRTIQTRA
jgi:hypothetical protein